MQDPSSSTDSTDEQLEPGDLVIELIDGVPHVHTVQAGETTNDLEQ